MVTSVSTSKLADSLVSSGSCPDRDFILPHQSSVLPSVLSETESSVESFFKFLDLDIGDLDQELDMGSSVVKPAAPLLKASSLKNVFFHFKHENVDKFFVDKKVPTSA